MSKLSAMTEELSNMYGLDGHEKQANFIQKGLAWASEKSPFLKKVIGTDLAKSKRKLQSIKNMQAKGPLTPKADAALTKNLDRVGKLQKETNKARLVAGGVGAGVVGAGGLGYLHGKSKNKD